MKAKIFEITISHLLLTVITLVILLLPLGTGMFYGSEGDWYSQHVGIAESLRQTMLETKSLIPQYINLGGGSSIYDFAYYGLLRPDVLFSCMVPDMEMKYVIAGYAVLGVIASVNLCYLWLQKQRLSKSFAFAGAVLLAASSCFYQAHHQIMFVNYMPFLFLALMGVDRLLRENKITLLVISLFMIYIHSFYYAIACLFVIEIYTIHQVLQRETIQKLIEQRKWKQLIKTIGRTAGMFMAAIAVSIGMAMVLLLPTGLDILSNEKDAGSFGAVQVKVFDWGMEGLLYSPYGCGMTLLTLYCLLLSLTKKRKRFLSITLIICVLFPVVSYVLNGFLYARSKILIPFVALFVLVAADTLQDLYQGKQKHCFVLLLCCLIPVFCSLWKPLLLLDEIILFIWLSFWQMGRISKTVKHYIFWLVFLTPVLVSVGINMSDSYLKPFCQKLGIGTNGAYLKTEDDRQKHFTSGEITEFVDDSRYRFDVLSNNFVNSNLLANGNINKTAMYSSVTNTVYARFYYDTMRNAISLNNRVALVPCGNPCFSYFMGQKYLLADKENLPDGYKKVVQKGNYILARNDDVLPVCYGTTNLFSEENYKKLRFPDTLEILCSRAVVSANAMEIISSKDEKRITKVTGGISSNDTLQVNNPTEIFASHMQKENVEEFFTENGSEKLIHPSGKGESYTLPLTQSLQGKIVILSFHVESNNGKEVIISINGIKNKLSSKSAPYPNNNHDFTYVLSAGHSIDELKVEVSKGDYAVNNLEIYTIDKKYLQYSDVVIPQTKEPLQGKNESVFQGNITMKKAGYFITSYPYRKGYQIKVDGVSVEAEKVNTAFIGFPITAGKHEIAITYVAPGFKLGCIVSILSCLLLVMIILWETRKLM